MKDRKLSVKRIPNFSCDLYFNLIFKKYCFKQVKTVQED